jgi:hypothetical protein
MEAMTRDLTDTVKALATRVNTLREELKLSKATVEQRHLEQGTEARDYWHYGYLMALTDILKQIEEPCSAERDTLIEALHKATCQWCKDGAERRAGAHYVDGARVGSCISLAWNLMPLIEPAIRDLIAEATADALEAAEQLARDFDDDAVAAAIHELTSLDIAAKAKERPRPSPRERSRAK